MAGVAKQIIGSFEDLGKQVGSEVIKAPADIAGKALESLGTSSGKKQQGQQIPLEKSTETGDVKPTPLDQLDQTKDQKTRQAIAHAALQYLAEKKQQKAPSVWEKIQKEEGQKKEQAQKQAAQAAFTAPVSTPSKPKRGNLYGIKQKASLEKSRNVRQD